MAEHSGRPVSAAAVVCLYQDRVLLVQRGREPNLGRWSFPGGKTESGETARQTAVREALEETGLRVRVLDVVDVYDAIFPPYHYCVADYLAIPEDEFSPMPAGDVMAARWVPFEDLDEYDLTEAMVRVLDRARWMLSIRHTAPPSLGMELEAVPPAGIGNRQKLRSQISGLYVITDTVEIARAALEAGARVIQLRDKHRDAGDLLPIAREICSLCRTVGAVFIVNDRVDLAVACDADGVHLGQTDLPVSAARKLLSSERLIGISVENEAQVLAAERDDADYLGVGPIYATSSKSDAGEAVGPDQLRRFRVITDLPIVAIGGITADRIPELRAAGADSAAVISAVAAAEDPVSAARTLAQGFAE